MHRGMQLLCMFWVWTFVIIMLVTARFYVRRKLRAIGWDDWTMLISIVRPPVQPPWSRERRVSNSIILDYIFDIDGIINILCLCFCTEIFQTSRARCPAEGYQMGMDYPATHDSHIWNGKGLRCPLDFAPHSKDYLLAPVDTIHHYRGGCYWQLAGSYHHICAVHACICAVDSRNAGLKLLGPCGSGAL